MSFNKKSEESKTGMSLTELKAYKSEIVAHAKSEGLSQEDVLDLHKENLSVSELIHEKALSEKVGAEELDALKSEIKSITAQTVKGLESALKTQGAVLDQMKSQGAEGSAKKQTLRDAIKSALIDQEDQLKALSQGEKIEIDLDVKAVGSITGGNVIGSNANLEPMPQRIGIINTPQFVPFITELIDSGTTNRANIEWIDEKNQEGDCEFVVEGAIKPQLDMDFEPFLSSAKKIAGFIKVGEESLLDFDWLAGEIEKKLRRRHDIEKERGIIFGDSSNAGEFDGITKNASAFVGGTLAGTIPTPNNYDVIRASIAQIVNIGKGEFMPNYVLVNPDDAGAMDLEKGTDGHYMFPPFVVNTPEGVQQVSMVRVIEKPQITAGSFVIGDFSKSHEREYVPFSIRVGYTDDDFKRNMRTIIGESRCHHFISSVEYNAFIFDTFANAKTVLLETPPTP